MRTAAILLAGEPAPGARQIRPPTPDAFLPVAGLPALRLAAASLAPSVSWLLPVGDVAAIEAALSGIGHLPPVAEAGSPLATLRAAAEALAAEQPELVLIHDAARPLIPAGTVPTLLEALRSYRAAAPALAVTDPVRRVRPDGGGASVTERGLYRLQTPQGFHFPTLLALLRAAPDEADLLDLFEQAGHAVALLPGSEDNIRPGTEEDLVRLDRMLTASLLPRSGTGYDVHVLTEGRPLILCGVTVPHERGLAGHSDADVGIHALCDAIYGALAEGDIGRHFPPSEATWKDADSARFLRHAAERIAARGGVLSNADVTLICERPKIAPHAEAMRARLADLLNVPVGRISVKATTTERLGFTGRGEGIAALATVTVLVPPV
ncbi:MAG TPA: 2-C-methyl-D-erythritol 2,4-cyclodiphosphate synthase [Acetobacteraceae bacterium]|nr:2-C-methyl-D-erythritol 2,4-cyclodiphosphate synthase [Acetobacteraceae bacterium]